MDRRRELAWWALAIVVAGLLWVGLRLAGAPDWAWFVLGASLVAALVRLTVWEHARAAGAELAALPAHHGWDTASPLEVLEGAWCVAQDCRQVPLRRSIFCTDHVYQDGLLCWPEPSLVAESGWAAQLEHGPGVDAAAVVDAALADLEQDYTAARLAIIRLQVLGPPTRHTLPDIDGDVIEVCWPAAAVRELTAGAR